MTLEQVPQKNLSIKEQAELEVTQEMTKKAVGKMKDLMRNLKSAEAVVASIKLQIIDLEKQIEDGTV